MSVVVVILCVKEKAHCLFKLNLANHSKQSEERAILAPSSGTTIPYISNATRLNSGLKKVVIVVQVNIAQNLTELPSQFSNVEPNSLLKRLNKLIYIHS